MNFGHRWRTPGIVDVDYRVDLPRAFVLEYLREELPAYIEDSKNFPDPESGIDRALETAGWPSASEVLTRLDLTYSFAKFYAHELMLRWFGDTTMEGQHRFVLNTIERVEVADEYVVTISGTARRTGSPVQFQDL